MNRREALKGVALLTGGALSPSIVSAVLSGITIGDSGKKWVSKIVNPEENDLSYFVEDSGERLGKDHSYSLDSSKIRNKLSWENLIVLIMVQV